MTSLEDCKTTQDSIRPLLFTLHELVCKEVCFTISQEKTTQLPSDTESPEAGVNCKDTLDWA